MRAPLLAALVDDTDPENPLLVRAPREDELTFVRDSWLKSYSHSGFAVQRGTRYWETQGGIATWCMSRGHVLVATNAEAPDVVLGWVCGARAPATIDFVYVKSEARRLGVASLLVQAIVGGAPSVRMTHRPWAELRAMVEKRGWYLAPIQEQEMV